LIRLGRGGGGTGKENEARKDGGKAQKKGFRRKNRTGCNLNLASLPKIWVTLPELYGERAEEKAVDKR